MPYRSHQKRVEEVINLYRSNPRLFSDEDLDRLQEVADQTGLKFNPTRDEFSMMNILKTGVSGFVEGLTTIPVGQKPKTTYESIAHSMGHLIGFAPAIMAGPLGLASKGATKLGLEGTKKVLQKGVKSAQILDKIAVPMIASRFSKDVLNRGLKKAGLESLDFMKKGAKSRAILEEAVGLGTASAVSGMWRGPDDMMHGFVGGAIAGGAFGGIGNFVSIANRLKHGTLKQRQVAEKALRGSIGATVTGLPSYLRDEPIEMVLYETLLGGFFGYNARPAAEVEGGKFLQRSLYGGNKETIFQPQTSKVWDALHPKAQEYITKQTNREAVGWLYRNYEKDWVDSIIENDVVAKAEDVRKITNKDRLKSYRNLAHELYMNKQPKKKETTTSLEDNVEDGIYREDSDHSVVTSDIVAMMKSIGNAVNKYSKSSKISPTQVATDINQTFEKSENVYDFINSLKNSPLLGKNIDKGLERKLKQFYHQRQKAPKEAYVIEIDSNGARRESVNGNWKDNTRVGLSMVDMPVHYLDPNGTHNVLTHIRVKRNGNWEIRKPLEVKFSQVENDLGDRMTVSERAIKGSEYFEVEYDLHKTNQYIISGKKDKQEVQIRDYHKDAYLTPEEMIEFLSREKYDGKKYKNEKARLLDSLRESRKLAYKWFDSPLPQSKLEGKNKTIKEMHDKAWVSNILTLAERNGWHTTGDKITDSINMMMSTRFGKNVIDYNKRTQLEYDRSVPQHPSVYANELPDGKLKYIVLKDLDGSSATDGTAILRKNIFDRSVDSMGLHSETGILKSVFATKSDGGFLSVKNATRRANKTWEAFLNENNIDAVFFESAVKNAGNTEAVTYEYKNGKIVANNLDYVSNMPIKDYRINPSTYESDKLGFMGIPRQVSSILNHVQTPGIAEHFFKTIIEPSLNGVKDYKKNYTTASKVLSALKGDPEFVWKMPMKDINEYLRTDSAISREIRKQIMKLDSEGAFFEYGDSDYKGFHEKNLRLFKLGEGDYSTAEYHKFGHKYWETTYKRFVLSRYMQPKYKASSKAVLLPKTPDVGIDLKIDEILLDNGQKNMPVNIEGRKDIKTLGQLFEASKKDPSLDTELTIVRVPADSVSGVRVVKLKGFTGEKGFGAITHPEADRYLGGADKDIDSIFIFHGFDKTLKDAYKNKKNSTEWDGIDVKTSDNLFTKGSEGNKNKWGEDIYKLVESKFSPSMRKFVAESATTGKENTLPYGLTQKNILMEIADIVTRKGGSITLPIYTKKGKVKAQVTLKLKENGHDKLRFLGREVVNYSADSAEFANMIKPTDTRNLLFNEVFDMSVKTAPWMAKFRKGKGFESNFETLMQTELRDVKRLISFMNPGGKNYAKNKAHTLDDIKVFLNSYNNKNPQNIHHFIAERMKQDGYGTSNFNASEVKQKGLINDLIDKDVARVTGIRSIKWITEKAFEKGIENSDNPHDLIRDFVFKNVYTKTSLDTIYKRSKDFIKQMQDKDGLTEEVAIKYLINKVRQNAIDIRQKSLINKDIDFDTLVRKAKEEIALDMKMIGKKPNIANEILDMWLLSPMNNIEVNVETGAGVVKSQPPAKGEKEWGARGLEVWNKTIESEAISDSAIQKLQKSFNDYMKPTEVKEPTFQENKISAEKTDKFDRLAIKPEDMQVVREFKDNLDLNKQWKDNFNDRFTEWTMLHEIVARDASTLSIADIYRLNNHFKQMKAYPDSPEFKKSIWYQDPRTINVKNMKHDLITFEQYQVPVRTSDGIIKRTVKRHTSTIGAMRGWMHKMLYQQESLLDLVDAGHDITFPFRKDLNIKDSGMINDLVFKMRRLKRDGRNWNEIVNDPQFESNKNKKFTVKGREYSLIDLIGKVNQTYTTEFQKIAREWLHTRNEKGERFDWSTFDGTGKVNEYLIFDNNGKLDINNFLRKAVFPLYKGGKLPIIPIDTILRFHYEYNMEKKLKSFSKKDRDLYRKSNPFKPVNQINPDQYFPQRYGHNAESRRIVDKEIELKVKEKYDEVLRKTGSKEEAEKASELLKAKYKLFTDRTTSDTAGIETDVLDKISERLDYTKLTAEEISTNLDNIGSHTRPDSTIERTLDLSSGFDTSTRVIDQYKKQIIRSHYKLLGAAMGNHRIDSLIKRKAFEVDVNGNKTKYSKEDLKNLNDSGYKNWTEVWADFLRFYLRDSFGHPTTFPQRIIDSMGKSDPLKLKKNFYYITSDQAIMNGVESLNKKFLRKTGRNLPFLKNAPKGNTEEAKKARKEYYSRILHKMGGLEAKYQLMTLLAHTGVVTGNVFGGQTMNITSAGFRNVTKAHSFNWIKKNILDKGDVLTLSEIDPSTGKNKVVKTRKDLHKWVAEKGAIDNFIKNEFEINDGLKRIKGVTAQNINNFRKELTKLLRSNPDARKETILELAKRYGMQDAVLKAGGSFMQVSERYLRTTSFLSHALQAREAFGRYGHEISLNDPYIVDMGLKGIENTQFLYHSAFRPAFMRTSLGKVFTRFKLFAFQSMRTRKEYYKMAKEMGFQDDKEAMKKFKNLMTADLLTLALGSIYAYSLFDTALPPPWDYLKETSEWLFGSKKEKERAFFGTYPYPLAPLQIITPPVARIPMSIFSTALNGDWDRFVDYNIHTMYPFGRLVRSLDKTIYDKNAGKDIIKEHPHGTTFGRFMKQFFRIPVDKMISKREKSLLNEKREQYKEQLLEAE